MHTAVREDEGPFHPKLVYDFMILVPRFYLLSDGCMTMVSARLSCLGWVHSSAGRGEPQLCSLSPSINSNCAYWGCIRMREVPLNGGTTRFTKLPHRCSAFTPASTQLRVPRRRVPFMAAGFSVSSKGRRALPITPSSPYHGPHGGLKARPEQIKAHRATPHLH